MQDLLVRYRRYKISLLANTTYPEGPQEPLEPNEKLTNLCSIMTPASILSVQDKIGLLVSQAGSNTLISANIMSSKGPQKLLRQETGPDSTKIAQKRGKTVASVRAIASNIKQYEKLTKLRLGTHTGPFEDQTFGTTSATRADKDISNGFKYHAFIGPALDNRSHMRHGLSFATFDLN